MTDIVERLRDYAINCGGPPEEYLTWQAADEIERLREALRNIVIGGIGETNWDTNEIRTYAEDALRQP